LPRKKKQKKEISVHAPAYVPKKEPILKDTTGTEALDVFKVAKNVDKALSFVVVAVGIFIIVLSAYSYISSINLLLTPLFIYVIGFAGSVNILCGLLLLSKK
jgi:uncharacterized Tic20 family protein